MGSPGAGKTTLLEQTIAALKDELADGGHRGRSVHDEGC
jgi:nucleoside-triphosphatase THEP1